MIRATSKSIRLFLILFIQFGLLPIVGCRSEVQTTYSQSENAPPNVVSTQGPTNDEYVVYSFLLNNEKPLDASKIIIADQTTFGNVAPTSTLDDVKSVLQHLTSNIIDPQLVAAFVEVNKTNALVTDKLQLIDRQGRYRLGLAQIQTVRSR